MSTAYTFYTAGGTLRPDSPSYVERHADGDLYDGLIKGEFCYVLTSRQMGKSSLMVRTSNRLRQQGINVVVLDLTAIGQNLTPEQWYDGLAVRLGCQLDLEDQTEEYWRAQQRLSPVQRFMTALRDLIMANRAGPIVIFVDETDTVRSLPFATDEFFAGLRECYNRRAQETEFNRLTFCLLGVAMPSDLIRDTRITPFNIGRRIELNDFTAGDAAPLANGLGREAKEAAQLLDRILHWTNGHPYLTQRLCQAVAEDTSITSPGGVDRACEGLFLSNRAKERDDNLLFVRERLLRGGANLADLLSLYGAIRRGKRVRDDEANPLVNLLRLAGIVRVEQRWLRVRNRIYSQVFDEKWVLANLPDQEMLRQKAAFKQGLLRGSIAVLGVVLTAWLVQTQLSVWHVAQATAHFGAIYQQLHSYADVVEITQELQMEGGARVTPRTVVQMQMQKPGRLSGVISVRTGLMDYDVALQADGKQMAVISTNLEQIILVPVPRPASGVFDTLGTLNVDLPFGAYQLFLAGVSPSQTLNQKVRNLRFVRKEELDGTPAYLFAWDEITGKGGLPVKIWVARDDGHFLQMVQDYTGIVTQTWMPSLVGSSQTVNIERLVITTRHLQVKLDPPFPPKTFELTLPPQFKNVERFDVKALAMAQARGTETEPRIDPRRLAELVPPRDPGASRELIDLSRAYNAPLTEPWHSSRAGNDLSSLPRGLQTLAGTVFDIRGVVQLAGRAEPYLIRKFPEKFDRLPVGLKCHRLHFLQGTGWTSPSGAMVGYYLIKMANGEQRLHPIIYGYDVRDWWTSTNEPSIATGLTSAWTGPSHARAAANSQVSLFKSTWINPLPEVTVESIDFVSALANSAPFLIAVTAD